MAGLQNLWGRKEGALTKKEIFANDIPSDMDLAWHYKVFIHGWSEMKTVLQEIASTREC